MANISKSTHKALDALRTGGGIAKPKPVKPYKPSYTKPAIVKAGAAKKFIQANGGNYQDNAAGNSLPAAAYRKKAARRK